MFGWNEEIKNELGACGQNVFIGHNVIFARPKEVFLGDNVRIDPFSFIACGLVANGYNQLGTHTIMNGRKTVHLGKWVGFGYRVTILTGSEDFTGEHGPANDWFGENPSFEGDVKIQDYADILTGATVMPGVKIERGVVIAANSLVTKKDKLMPFYIYGMRPEPIVDPHKGLAYRMRLHPIKQRNMKNIIAKAQEWENDN